MALPAGFVLEENTEQQAMTLPEGFVLETEAQQPQPVATPPAKEEPAPANVQFSPENVFARFFDTAEPTTETTSTLQEAVVKPGLGFAKGLITDLPVGIVQLATNALGSDASAEKINAWVDAYNHFGDASEATRFVGSMFIPVAKVLQGVSLTGKIVKGTATGTGFALISPTSEAEKGSYWQDKTFQAGLSGILSGALPVFGKGLGKIGELISDINLTDNARSNAIREYLIKLTGKEKAKTIQQIRNYGAFVQGSKPTVAETISETPSAVGLIGEQNRVARQVENAPDYLVREAEQQQARLAALGRIATPRGTSPEQVVNARAAATQGLREDALSRANVYGEQAPAIQAAEAAATGRPVQPGQAGTEAQGMVGALQAQGKAQTEAAQAVNRADNWTPVPGMPQFPGRYSPNMERAAEQRTLAREMGDLAAQKKAEVVFHKEQLKSLGEQGFFPLQTGDVQQTISTLATTKGLRATEGVPEALRSVSKQISDLTDNNGLVDSHDLYAIRKNVGNIIRDALTGKSITPDEKIVAGAAKQIQGAIDASINKAAGNTSWTRYLNNYSKYSDKLDRMKIGKALVDALGGEGKFNVEQAGAFAQAVYKSESLVAEATGKKTMGRMQNVLTPREMAAVENVLADLKRKVKASDLASRSERPTGEVGSLAPKVNLLDRTATFIEGVYRYAKQGNQAQMDNFVADLMLDPNKFADFLEATPTGFMDNMMRMIFKTASPELSNSIIRKVTQAGALQSGQ
jgi:polyhydroxyalkanoate synthesis regulator phasin